MGEFITGLGGASPTARAQASYPDNPRAAALGLFARNFASGPESNAPISGGGIQIPWFAVESPIKFTITPNGTTVTIPGDVRDSFDNGDSVEIIPLTPAVLAPVSRTISGLAFGGGVTTFVLNTAIDATTTGGFIFDTDMGTVDVPITPRTTGVVLVSGVVTFKNKTGDPVDEATIQVAVDGVAQTVPFDLQFGPLAAGDSVTLPFMAELLPFPLGPMAVGTKAYIQIIVTGDGLSVLAEDSALSIQEVSFATG
jgi:hypothetical protein